MVTFHDTPQLDKIKGGVRAKGEIKLLKYNLRLRFPVVFVLFFLKC